MRNNLIVKAGFKPAPTLLSATLALAITFTLSCSDDKDDGVDSSSSGSDTGLSSSGGTDVGGGLSSAFVSDSSGTVNSSSSGGIPAGGSSSSGGGAVAGDTVSINGQVWMKKNLDFAAEGSKCYNDSIANCAKYGRLYDWATAMGLPSKCNEILSTEDADCAITAPHHRGICPTGYHIPTNADWDKLYRSADGTSGTESPYNSETAGRILKATSGWNNDGNGTDSLGFAALPGGYGYSSGNFSNAGSNGIWWSASESDADYAYNRPMSYNNEYALYSSYDKSYGLFSVRCVKD